jgi:hypothetical protein
MMIALTRESECIMSVAILQVAGFDCGFSYNPSGPVPDGGLRFIYKEVSFSKM